MRTGEWIETKLITKVGMKEFEENLNWFLFEEWKSEWDFIDIKYSFKDYDDKELYSALVIFKVRAKKSSNCAV